MKCTGIVRRLDDLGRIVIPKEIRRTLKIKEGDALELFVEDNSLILKKYNDSDEIIQNCADWVNKHHEQIISISMINETTICVFKTDNEKLKSASATHYHSDKFDMNVAICYCAKQVGFEIEGI